MNEKEVTDLLKKAYRDEIETVMNYLTNSIILEGVRAEEIKESLKADIQEELNHAEMLGERLKQLGERPPASKGFKMEQKSLQPPEDSTDVLSVIDGVIEAEKEAISIYKSIINVSNEIDDPVTEDLAVTILTDEEAHKTEFIGYRKEYKKD